MQISRRQALVTGALASTSAAITSQQLLGSEESDFKLNYLLASSLYGYTNLAEILPQVSKSGASAIDVWPMVHGNQREQIDEIGEQRFLTMLGRSNVKLG